MILAEPRPTRRQRLGLRGEREAEDVLLRAGLEVLDRRFRLRGGEIDLVALDGDVVVFVEVKARRLDGYGAPAEAVTPRKQRRIARTALAWLKGRGWLERVCRFDVIELWGEPDGPLRTRHRVDAFRLWPTG
jgi:putative endonuclease